MIFPAEVHQSPNARVGFERVRGKDLSHKDLMVAAGIHMDDFALHIGQAVAQERLTFGTFKIQAARPLAVFLGEELGQILLIRG
jgi:hypothetical protein